MEKNEPIFREPAGGTGCVRRVQAPICEKEVPHEVTGDFTLPDYQPEIRRLLRITATPGPVSRFVGGGSVECSGVIDFNVFYTGTDGQLCCAPLESDYRIEVPLGAALADGFDLNDGLVCLCDNRVESTVGRVLAPRRLTLRCRVRSDVKVLGTKVYEDPIDASDTSDRSAEGEDGTVRLSGEVPVVAILCGVSEPIEVEDEITVDGLFSAMEKPDEGDGDAETRVICADGVVTVENAVPGNGSVDLRGNLEITMILERAGEIRTVLRKMPFAGNTAVDGIEPEDGAAATGFCTDLEIRPENDGFVCRATVRVEVTAEKKGSLSYLRDAFSTERDCRVEFAERVLQSPAGCFNCHFSQSGSAAFADIGLKEPTRGDMTSMTALTVIPVGASAGVDTVETAPDGRQALVGTCRIPLICRICIPAGRASSDEAVVSSAGDFTGETVGGEITFPFRYEVEKGNDRIVSSGASARVTDIRVRTDGGKVISDCEISLSVPARGETRIRAVSALSFGDALPRERGKMKICYPESGETLWQTAKACGVSPDELARENGLVCPQDPDAPDSLQGIRFLMLD